MGDYAATVVALVRRDSAICGSFVHVEVIVVRGRGFPSQDVSGVHDRGRVEEEADGTDANVAPDIRVVGVKVKGAPVGVVSRLGDPQHHKADRLQK